MNIEKIAREFGVSATRVVGTIGALAKEGIEVTEDNLKKAIAQYNLKGY